MIETQVRSPAASGPPAPLRHLPPWWPAAAFAAVLWPLLALCILAHRIFVSNDSVSTYAHVWWVADSIWQNGRVPFAMPVLNHGDGLAFPYGAPAWTLAALLWRVLGEWAVTLLLVLAAVATVLAAVRWQPRLREPFLLVLFLLNPFLIEALLLAQFPFLWACVFFFLGAAALRGRRYGWAAVALALAQGTHPAIMLPPVAVLVALTFHEQRRRAVLLAYAASLIVAAPAVWLTLVTPALGENGRLAVLLNYVGTLAPRSLVLLAPPLLVRSGAWLRRHAAPAAFVAVALPFVVLPSLGDLWALKQLVRPPDATAAGAVNDPSFSRGSVYRVLDAADGKMSMYRVLRAGGVLDGDFFPESLNRRSWPDEPSYLRFLSARRVQYVVITPAYDRDFHTNEHALLRSLASEGDAMLVYQDRRAEVYRLNAAR